jgi:hypothetical protein
MSLYSVKLTAQERKFKGYHSGTKHDEIVLAADSVEEFWDKVIHYSN